MWTIADQYRYPEDYDFENSRYIEDIPFWLELCESIAGRNGAVLDLGCGTFREGIPIAELASQRGFVLTGVDISLDMLTLARTKLSKLPAQVQNCILLAVGDMENVRVGKSKYDLVIVPFNSFLHIVGTDRKLRTLRNIHAHLKQGGRFLADILVPDIEKLAGMRHFPKTVYEEFRITDENRGATLVRQVAGYYDQNTQVLECMYYYQIYKTPGKGELIRSYCLPFAVQMIFPNEWELLLRQAGFKILERWGSYDKRPFDKGSRNILFLCEKR